MTFSVFVGTSVDAIVIGRKTCEKVLTFGGWPYADKRVGALSSRPADLSAAAGGIAIQGFLRAGIAGRRIITRVPVLIGESVPLLGALLRDIRLRDVATRACPSGLVRSE